MHVKYTAREGGSALKKDVNFSLKSQLGLIKQSLGKTGLQIAINMKHDMPNEWHLLKNNGTIELKLDKSRLPYMAQSIDTAEIESVSFVVKIKGNPLSFTINVDGTATSLAKQNELQMCIGSNMAIKLNTLFNLSVLIDKEKMEELIMVVKYKF